MFTIVFTDGTQFGLLSHDVGRLLDTYGNPTIERVRETDVLVWTKEAFSIVCPRCDWRSLLQSAGVALSCWVNGRQAH